MRVLFAIALASSLGACSSFGSFFNGGGSGAGQTVVPYDLSACTPPAPVIINSKTGQTIPADPFVAPEYCGDVLSGTAQPPVPGGNGASSTSMTAFERFTALFGPRKPIVPENDDDDGPAPVVVAGPADPGNSEGTPTGNPSAPANPGGTPTETPAAPSNPGETPTGSPSDPSNPGDTPTDTPSTPSDPGSTPTEGAPTDPNTGSPTTPTDGMPTNPSNPGTEEPDTPDTGSPTTPDEPSNPDSGGCRNSDDDCEPDSATEPEEYEEWRRRNGLS